LRFEKDVIQQLFREEIMQESVIYQDILQKGKWEGKQEGLQIGKQEGKKENKKERCC
jgi:predicted transposase YdaD